MSKTLFKAMTFLPLVLTASMLYAQSTDDANTPDQATDPGMSKVRIVRLSQVRGAVQIDRSSLRGFETAIANLPVVERNKLQTEVGVAEVEFEDNSSLRLAPNSLVEFPKLERDSTGATISTVHIVKGSAYVSLVKASKAPANKFVVTFGDRKVELAPATHVRLTVGDTEAKLAVLDGTVQVNSENAAVSVPKKKTATFAFASATEPQTEPTIAKDIEPSPYDEWDHNEASYHANAASLRGVNSPYAYGTNDMAYYGSFVNAAGCGSMWRPYFASAAWQPYSNGSWAWYQGAGYSWVSPYPWAWTPYHYGSWSYCDGVGWGWMPGGGWNGLNNVASGMLPTSTAPGPGNNTGNGRIPHAPTAAPASHGPSLIAVNTRPLTGSEIASPTSFVFRKDSAGLGVPRGTMGNLHDFSKESLSHGTATTPIYATMPHTNRPNNAMTMSEAMGASIHRGSPQPAAMSERDSFGSFSGAGAGAGSPRAPVGTMPAARPAPAPAASAGSKK